MSTATTATGAGAPVAAADGHALWPAETSEAVCELTVGELPRAAAGQSPDAVAVRELVPAGGASLTGAAATDRAWTYAELLAEA